MADDPPKKPATPSRGPASPWLRIALITVITAAAAVGLDWLGLLEGFELRVLGMRFQWRSAAGIHDKILLVGIGDEDQKKLGKWPWPRSRQAEMLVAFTNSTSQPLAIAYNAVFPASKDEAGQAADAQFAGVLDQM